MAANKARKRKPRTSNPQALTPGTVIRMEEADSSRKPRPSKTKVIVQEVNPVHGFFDFLREHAVIGLIIGFVLGQQVQAVVKVLVDSFVNPLTYLLYGEKLSTRTFVLTWHGRAATFGWGALASAIIVFIIVLIILYVVIKLLNLDDLEKKEERRVTDDEFKAKLTPEQYHILREKGTEAPGSGALLYNNKSGEYRCAACDNLLFKSDTKFESTLPGLVGWPAFSDAAHNDAVKLQPDDSLGASRTEIICKNCGSHLGHLFDDPTSPNGQHFCVNSAALDFQEK